MSLEPLILLGPLAFFGSSEVKLAPEETVQMAPGWSQLGMCRYGECGSSMCCQVFPPNGP